MSSRTETWVAGIVGVAVGALLAVTVFLISQPPAAREQASGAIGAAERFRTEQIQVGDTGISGSAGAAGQFTAFEFAEFLGRAGSDLRIVALNQATLEQQSAMFANADVLEKVNSLFRVDSAMQKQIMEKMKVGERQAIERLSGERSAAQGKITAETLARVAPGERFNSLKQTTLEQQSAMFANMDAFEKAYAFARLDSAMQRQIVDRMEQGDKAAFERIVTERADFEKNSAEMLGRVGIDLRIQALNQATLEQQSAMFANADVLEKVNSLFRVDSAMQKQIMEKMNANERQAIERLSGERSAAQGKITAETLARVAPGERFNSLKQTTLEQQSAMFAKFDALEKAVCYGRLDQQMQRTVLDRMGPYERADFERALNERFVQDRISSGRVGQERVVNQRAVEQ